MEKLNLVLKNQLLRLALKVAILAFAILFFGGDKFFNFIVPVLYFWLYLRPSIKISHSLVIYGINLLPIFIVQLYPLTSISFWVFITSLFLSGLLLGIKDLVFVKREQLYHIAFSLLIAEFTFLFFAGLLGKFAYLYALLIFFILVSEYYRRNNHSSYVLHYSAVLSLMYAELLWSVSIIPISYLSKSFIAISFILLVSNIFLKKIHNNPLRKVLIRNGIIFLVLGVIASFILK